MRAVSVHGPGRARVDVAALPEPRAGEVLVRIEGCGVCGSNVPVWEGRPWFGYPLPAGAPGHEGWGVVERLGEGVGGVEVGTRVAFLSERAFAEYDVARADHLVPLPPQLDRLSVPGEALGCAVNVLRRSRVESGESIAVVGVGFLGAVVLALAVAVGARVTAISRRPFSLDVAARLGADRTFTLDEAPDETFACVIEAAGVQETLDLAGRLTAVRGRLVIAGYHQDGSRTVDMQLWNWRGLDVVNAHERDPEVYLEGMRAAVDAVRDDRLDLAPLVTHTFPLDRAAEALEAARTRPDGFLKAVVTP